MEINSVRRRAAKIFAFFTFVADKFSSGVYFARMIVNPATQTAGKPSDGSKQIVQVKKMLMLK